MKFSQMKYERPELPKMQSTIRMYLDKFQKSATPQEAIENYIAFDEYVAGIETSNNLAYIHKSMDTNNQFYKDEMDFWDETWPILEEVIKPFNQALLSSPFRKEMEEKWGAVLFVNAEMALKTFKPEIVEDLQVENALSTEYEELEASAQIPFNGKTLNLAEFGAYYENKDPEIRRRARDAVAGWWLENGDKMDEIFDKMVAVRTKIAKTLGYDNFVQLGYDRMGRNCYNAADVAKFRQGIVDYIVPLSNRLKAQQAKRIGVDKITLYDNAFHYPDGNAKPIGNPKQILEHGRKMYQEMSPETAEYIDHLLDNGLIDVLTRPGKQSGGYCSVLSAYKASFIFANFDGTAGDIDVLTHEVGHAFAYHNARHIQPTGLTEGSMDICEIHSMSMEFFAWPWMEGFFGDQTEKYYDSHIAASVNFLPYGAMIDEFQHWVYENYNATPKDRHNHWAKLEEKYRPYLDQSGIPFYQDGRLWQNSLHIYCVPFYYIDYVLAGIVALGFWAENQQNPKAAWERYLKLVRNAGTKTFLDLIKEAELPNPFEPESMEKVTKAVLTFTLKGYLS